MTVWNAALWDLDPCDTEDVDFDVPIVPADIALAILASFFEGNDVELEFDDDRVCLADLVAGITESGAHLAVDWRAVLADELAIIEEQVRVLGISLRVSSHRDGCRATLEHAERTTEVKYVPADDDDFASVVARINALLAGQAEYRSLRDSGESDTAEYVVLPPHAWHQLRARHPRLIDAIFAPVEPDSARGG